MLGLLISCGPSKEQMEKVESKMEEFKSTRDVSKLSEDELRNYILFHYYGECHFTLEEKDAIAAKIKPLEVIETETEVITPVITTYNKFSSLETGLPTGTVVATDYEGNSKDDTMHRINNHVSIKCNDGFTRIVKDIDVDLFNNLHKGDIIE